MASRYTLTPQDVQAVNNTAARLGVRPQDLLAVIHYETIGTMNPTIKGGTGGRYQGLIQFGGPERRAYGYDKDASFAEQVEGPVYRYLKDRGLPYGASLGTIYRTVNGGNPKASLKAKDGPLNIGQHIQRIIANSLPQADMMIVNAGLPNTEAIMDVAARNPPTGAELGAPTALQGFAPNLPDEGFAPAQAAIAENFGQPGDLTADQIDELTRTDVAGNYLNQPQSQPLQLPPQWNPATSFPPPPLRRPGPGGALGVDLGMQPAGMPVPPPRPNNTPMPPPRPGTFDWLGGGAPPAATVPTPGISPLRPAFGGPGDRRPQPPIPPSRASGLPLPPMRPGNFDYMGGGAPNAAGLPLPPSRPMGMPPSAPDSPAGAFSPQAGPLDLVPFSTAPRSTPGALARESDTLARELGHNRRNMELYTAPTPPRPSFDQLQSESDSRLLASDIARTRGMMERSMRPLPNFDTPPPLAAGPDFTSANPSPLLPPSWSPVTSFPGETLALGPNEEPISAPPPLPPDFSGRFDPSPASWAAGNDLYVQNRFPASLFPQPTIPTPKVGDPGVSLPMTEPVADEPLIASPDPIEQAIASAPINERYLRRTDPNRPSLAARIGNFFLPGSPFGGGGGFIGPNGFFSNAGSFTPFTGAGAGGSSPFNMQPNGAMGSTTWRQGSVSGNPAMSGVMWNRSGGNGSVGYVTSPFTGDVPIYSGSPNRF